MDEMNTLIIIRKQIENNGLFGTEGYVIYRAVNTEGESTISNSNWVKLSWSVSLMGSRKCEELIRDGLGGFHCYVEQTVKDNCVFWKIVERQIAATQQQQYEEYTKQQQQYLQYQQQYLQQQQAHQPTYVNQKPTLQQQQQMYLMQQQFIQQAEQQQNIQNPQRQQLSP
jgi:hypothetical protein